jgi:ribosome-associated translation inhibitor RaiA
MQYHFIAPTLTKPTYETLELEAQKMFKKIERLVHMKDGEPVLRISVSKEGDVFIITAELNIFNNLLIKSKHRDLRRAISEASIELKHMVTKSKEKRNNFKIHQKVIDLRNNILNRNYIE